MHPAAPPPPPPALTAQTTFTSLWDFQWQLEKKAKERQHCNKPNSINTYLGPNRSWRGFELGLKSGPVMDGFECNHRLSIETNYQQSKTLCHLHSLTAKSMILRFKREQKYMNMQQRPKHLFNIKLTNVGCFVWLISQKLKKKLPSLWQKGFGWSKGRHSSQRLPLL